MKLTGFAKANLIIATVIVSLIIAGCKSGKDVSAYEQGVEALEQQNYAEALRFFNAAETSEKNMQRVFRGKGLSYLGLGQYEDALSSFEYSLSCSNGILKRVDYDINFYIAVCEYKMGNIDDAINTYTSIITADNDNADAYYLRGKMLLEQGKTQEAKSDFDTAITYDKDNPRLYINIHDDLVACGNEAEAKAYINAGLAGVSKPTSYELGILNYYLGDYTQARNYFEESNETKKSDDGIIYLGKTYVALDDVDYAIALYEEYINNNTTSDIVFNELGLLKAKSGDYKEALVIFERGLEVENGKCRQNILYNRIVANEFLGNFEDAKREMEEYIKLYPGDENAVRENIFLSTR